MRSRRRMTSRRKGIGQHLPMVSQTRPSIIQWPLVPLLALLCMTTLLYATAHSDDELGQLEVAEPTFQNISPAYLRNPAYSSYRPNYLLRHESESTEAQNEGTLVKVIGRQSETRSLEKQHSHSALVSTNRTGSPKGDETVTGRFTSLIPASVLQTCSYLDISLRKLSSLISLVQPKFDFMAAKVRRILKNCPFPFSMVASTQSHFPANEEVKDEGATDEGATNEGTTPVQEAMSMGRVRGRKLREETLGRRHNNRLTGTDIRYRKLTKIDLRYFQGIHCRGGNCPDLDTCEAYLPRSSTSVHACWNEFAVDGRGELPPPLVKESMDGNFSKSDPIKLPPTAGQVFLLRNVFINDRGSVFDRNHIYVHTILCKSAPINWKLYYAGRTNVTVFKEMASLVHWNGINFYHALLETMPTLLLLAPFLARKPTMMIGHLPRQLPHFKWFSLLGIQHERLRLVSLPANELFYVKRLILPIHASCGEPNHALIHQIRRDFLHLSPKAPKAPPGYNFEERRKWRKLWRLGPQLGALKGMKVEQTQTPAWPDDWTVVLGVREESRRILGWQDLLAKILKIVPATRVTLFSGEAEVNATQNLFRRARLFFSPHGAILANVFFMREGATVVEVRPNMYNNNLFEVLSRMCRLRYHLLWGEGDKVRPILVEHRVVLAKIRETMIRFLEEDQLAELSRDRGS
eukprot:TRINITY_DN17111_c0_g2_i1.p1 TRINITY_DN17111_c0_g2~~TRINITY_DN17111_c0_g2_i1.p1  ORF type:complete len:690 (-),score=12.00 TRINITY_DN17111_c0_g2_i1:95-2164(-)